MLDAIESLPPGDNALSLEVRFGLIATWILSQHGLEVTPESRFSLLKQVPKPAALATGKSIFSSFCAHVKDQSIERLTVKDITTWKDKLVTQGCSASIINGSYLACARALLAHDTRNGFVTQNVASGIAIKKNAWRVPANCRMRMLKWQPF